jgi:group I intron endonuclease
MKAFSIDLSVASQAQIRDVLNEMKHSGLTGGIYLWVNQTNGKFYVGSTLCFYDRILSYFYLSKRTINSILLNAFNKYGFSAFTLVLMTVPEATKNSVLELEQLVLDTFLPEYNIQPNASSSAGRILSEEHKAKIAASRKSVIFSEETKARMSTSHQEMKEMADLIKVFPYIYMKFFHLVLSLVQLFLIEQEPQRC